MALEYLAHLARLDTRDIHPGGAAASAVLLDALDVAPGHRVLECGCGTASTLERISRDPDVRGAGLDLLPEMLARAGRRLAASGVGERVVLARGSAERIPFRSEVFDGVLCESVLGFQKTRSLRVILREIFRVLRPGGRLVANEAIWKRGIEAALVNAINAGCERDFGLPQATELAWDVGHWVRELEAAGFHVVSCELLSELGTGATSPDDAPAPSDDAKTDSGDVLRRAVAWLSPPLLVERLRYRRLLASHRRLGVHVEGRLFVATRPSTSSDGAR